MTMVTFPEVAQAWDWSLPSFRTCASGLDDRFPTCQERLD